MAGARVEARAGGRIVSAVAGGPTSYASCVVAPVHLGLGDVAAVETIDVVWPGGERESFAVPGLDRFVTVHRGQGRK